MHWSDGYTQCKGCGRQVRNPDSFFNYATKKYDHEVCLSCRSNSRTFRGMEPPFRLYEGDQPVWWADTIEVGWAWVTTGVMRVPDYEGVC